jgi:Zn-dependent peptidase ImmA (M78 family)
MADFTLRIIQSFEKAKLINHYYWMYTPDGNQDRIRVENIQHIVERLTKLKVEKRAVQFEGGIVRGNYERHSDHIVINIRSGQPIEWVRYTITKELCHAVNDLPEEFSPQAEHTIRGLLQYAGVAMEDTASPALQSERLAELIAIELLYPIEFREEDIKSGASVREIVARRGIPSSIIQRCHIPSHLDACKHFWRALADVTPDPLEPIANGG